MGRKAGMGRAESDILRFIADKSPVTVREVGDFLAETKGQTRTTALNAMERLRAKGFLTREQQDGAYRYSLAQPKAGILRGLVGDFVATMLGGSLEPFAAYLTEGAIVSDDELARLKQAIAALEAQKSEETEEKGMSDFLDFCAVGLLSALWRGVWQGSIALIAVGAICRFVPRLPAALRCWLWRLAYVRLLIALFVPTTLTLPLLPASTGLAHERSAVAASRLAGNVARSVDGQDAIRKRAPGASLPGVAVETGLASRRGLDALRASLQHSPVRTNPVGTHAMRPRPTPNTQYLTPDTFPPKPEARNPNPALWLLIALVYLMGVAFCLTRLVIAYHRTRRLTEGATTITDSALIAEYAALAMRLSLRQKPALLVSPTADGPALVGKGFSGAIVLPTTLIDAAASDERRMALAHELAHAARHDLAWDWLGVAAQTLFFFHPLVYPARREERAAREMACDALAVSLTEVKPAAYGRLLLAIATRAAVLRPAPMLNAVGAVEKGTILMRRIEALKDISDRRISRRVVFGVAIALALAFIPFRLTAQAAKPEPNENGAGSPPSAAPKLPKKGEIEEFAGVAVTENGKPLPGAIALWIASPQWIIEAQRTTKPIATATADEKGLFRFRLANAPGHLRAGKRFVEGTWIVTASEGRTGWYVIDGLELRHSLRVTLSRPGLHEAEIVTPEGKPLPNIPVQVRSLSGGGGLLDGALLQTYIGGVKSGRTDANGKFRVNGMPAGKWAMFEIAGTDWAIVTQEMKPESPLFRMRYACVPATTISGTALLPDSRPAGSSCIYSQPVSAEGTALVSRGVFFQSVGVNANEKGQYTLSRLAPGRYRLLIRARESFVSRPLLVETTREKPAKNADFRLTSGTVITGTVTEAETGKPLAGVFMGGGPALGNADIADQSTITDAKGNYRLRVPSGVVAIQPMHEGSQVALAEKRRRELTVKDGETVTLNFSLRRKGKAAFSGIVTDLKGKPVPGAAIRFFSETPLPREIYTDKFGRFSFTGRFSASAVRVVARKGDYSASTTLFPGANAPALKLRLLHSPLSVVTGMVMDEKGRPIPGAKVKTIGREPGTDNTQDFDELTTTAQGRFYGKVWPEFDYLLWVEAKSYGWKSTPNDPRHNLHLSPGEKRDVGGLVLRTANSFVAGTLLDETGKPVGDAMVSVGDLQTFGFLSRTNAQGRFRVENVAAGINASLSVQRMEGNPHGLWGKYTVQTGTSGNVITLREKNRIQ